MIYAAVYDNGFISCDFWYSSSNYFVNAAITLLIMMCLHSENILKKYDLALVRKKIMAEIFVSYLKAFVQMPFL